jgi:hypothetical protein
MHEIKSNLPPGMKGFLSWLAMTQPRTHEKLLAKVTSPSLSGLGFTAAISAVTPAVLESTAPASASTADKVKDIILTLSQGYLTVQQMNAQKKVLDLQLARAKEGLPPLNLDMQQYGLTGPQVTVGMSPDTKKLLMIGGIGLGAVLLLPQLLGKRR